MPKSDGLMLMLLIMCMLMCIVCTQVSEDCACVGL